MDNHGQTWEDKSAPNPRALRDRPEGPRWQDSGPTHQPSSARPLYLSAPSERKRPEPGQAAFASPPQSSALCGDHQQLVAHCHLGLGKLYGQTCEREQAHEHLTIAATMYREMDMRFWLEQAEVNA